MSVEILLFRIYSVNFKALIKCLTKTKNAMAKKAKKAAKKKVAKKAAKKKVAKKKTAKKKK